MKSHAVPKEDVHAPGIEVLGGAALVSIMTAAAVESDLGQGVAENASVHSEELPVNPEPEETVTHEEPVPISSTSLEIPEANVPVTIETEPELRSMNFTTEHEASTLEVEERHILLPPEYPEAVNESNGESISFIFHILFILLTSISTQTITITIMRTKQGLNTYTCDHHLCHRLRVYFRLVLLTLERATAASTRRMGSEGQ